MVEDAAAEYSAFFAGKVIGMIRAPDDYLYPPPFNIIEIFLVAPFELVQYFISPPRAGQRLHDRRFIVSEKVYAKVSLVFHF